MHSNGATFPFAAIVGQDLMRLSLALNAINPSIGGVLIRGERGTAKSTAVRGLAAVLPEIEVATCTYGCAPRLVERLRGLPRAAQSESRHRVDHPPGSRGRPAGVGYRGSRDRHAGPGSGVVPRRAQVRTGATGSRPPRPAVCGRSQPAGRPPGGHAAGQRGLGHESDRTRRASSTGIPPNTSWSAR